MKIRKILGLAILLLLLFGGIAVAQSSPNFITQRFALYSISSAQSTNYEVTGIIGQPATGVSNSPEFQTTGGFLLPGRRGANFNHKIWLPIVSKK